MWGGGGGQIGSGRPWGALPSVNAVMHVPPSRSVLFFRQKNSSLHTGKKQLACSLRSHH